MKIVFSLSYFVARILISVVLGFDVGLPVRGLIFPPHFRSHINYNICSHKSQEFLFFHFILLSKKMYLTEGYAYIIIFTDGAFSVGKDNSYELLTGVSGCYFSFFGIHKHAYPLSNRFTFRYFMLFAVFLQFFFSFCIKPYAITNILGIFCFRSAHSW